VPIPIDNSNRNSRFDVSMTRFPNINSNRDEVMNRAYNPSDVAPPPGAYSHGVEVPANARLVFTAGQVGRGPDGTIPENIRAQTEQAWKNVVNVLKGSDMGVEDIVKLSALLVKPEDLEGFLAVNDQFLGDHRPASTLMVLQSLARPQLLVEIEAVAAKA
jgi:enamine deaminase RidA (YjgF/YER057c/UK114 family)